MADPISGSVAMQQMPKVDLEKLDKAAKTSDAPKNDGGQSFKDVMAQKVDATQQAQAPEKTQPAQSVQRSEMSQKVDKFVEGVLSDEKRIEKMMARCGKGQTLEQGELLQLQGLIYGYAQKVDLASKVVDKATGGLKQVMNTQV